MAGKALKLNALGLWRLDRLAGAAIGVCAALTLQQFSTPSEPATATPASKSLLSIVAPAPKVFDPASVGPITVAATDRDLISDPPLPKVTQKTEKVRSGDTLMGVMTRAGAPRVQAYDAISELRSKFDPRDLRPGQQLTLTFHQRETEESPTLAAVSLPAAADRTVEARRTVSGQYEAAEHVIPTRAETLRFDGEITSSLFETAVAMGAPAQVMADMVKHFSYDVDFQRDIWKGDRFELMYERHVTPDGTVARNGNITYAALVLRGKKFPIYLFEDSDGFPDYFNAEGKGVRKALMRTPINGARLSSSFGKRRHPVLGYTKMHKGVDFAAPTGTPIYAAGDGWIEKRERYGGFGNYIRIRHNSEFKTAYAHMHRFANGLGVGSRVRQGQVIGYVGTTGRSTGPHLHYEIHKNGGAVNPLKVRFPSSEVLKGERLEAFLKTRQQLDTRYASLPSRNDYAAVNTIKN